MNLTLNHILTLHQQADLQLALGATQALEITIDYDDLLEQHVDETLLSDSFIFLENCLSKNSSLESVGLSVYSDEDELDPQNLLINHCFSALGSIRVPVKKLHLKLSSQAFSEDRLDLIDCSVFSESPAFQALDALILENHFVDYAIDSSGWAYFFIDILERIPNKSSLQELNLLWYGLEVFNDLIELPGDVDAGINDTCHSLIHSILQCDSLNRLNIEGNYLPDSVLSSLGGFIKNHPTLTHVLIDAQNATSQFDFVIPLLQNAQLKDVSLMLTYNSEPASDEDIETVELIGNQIQRLVGLSRLQLKIDLDTLFHVCMPRLLKASLMNPTLSALDIDFQCDDIQHGNIEHIDGIDGIDNILGALSTNPGLTRIQHTFPLDSMIAQAFTDRTTANLARQAQFLPLFRFPPAHEADEVFYASFTTRELISAHAVWLSLMSSYALTPPANQTLSTFNCEFFSLTAYQFFVSIHGPQRVFYDPCIIVAEYLTIQDIAGLARVTGGCLFRNRKPLVIQPPALLLEPAPHNRPQYDFELIEVNSEADFDFDAEGESPQHKRQKRH